MPLGGHEIARALSVHGVEHIFSVAGESYLPVLDGLVDYADIELLTCRQESGATFGAEAYANATGKTGVALVTRGPGACNASIGVHTAMQSSTPMVLLIGLIGTDDRDKEAFQEFDIKQMFGSISKWASTIDMPERIGEYMDRAFHVAHTGRPGPVVLGLPEEVLTASISQNIIKPYQASGAALDASDVQAITDLLSAAERPLVIAGGGSWSDKDCDNLSDFASASHLPVVTSFRRQDLMNNTHGNYWGELGTSSNPDLLARVKKADLLIVLNARLNEIMSQEYTLFEHNQKIIHIHNSSEEIGKAGYRPDLAIEANISKAMNVLAAQVRVDGRSWAGWRDEGQKAYQEWTNISADQAQDWNGTDVTQLFSHLRDALDDDAIITTDAGNFSGWCQRFIRYGRPGRLLAPVSGAMGYAVPSAVAASIAYPGRQVIGFCGDGGFMMTGQELAMAMHHGAKPIIFVFNNGVYGTIKMHQEKHYPGRPSATSLTNPDFVKLAESYGVYGARITDANQFEDVWAEVQKQSQQRPCLIEVMQDPLQVTTRSQAA